MLCPDTPMDCITNQGYGHLALIPTCPPRKSAAPRDSEENRKLCFVVGFFFVVLFFAATLNCLNSNEGLVISSNYPVGSILWPPPKHKLLLRGMSLPQRVPPVLESTARLGQLYF